MLNPGRPHGNPGPPAGHDHGIIATPNPRIVGYIENSMYVAVLRRLSAYLPRQLPDLAGSTTQKEKR